MDNYRLAETLTFLEQLASNNNKAWFDSQRAVYEQNRAGFTQLVEDWIAQASQVDANLLGQTAKASLFRINRDVRFSANKAPYKINFSAYLSKGGKKYPGAGYYFHLQPDASFLAAGIWMPPADILSAIRQEIDYNWTDFKKILENPSFAKRFSVMSDEKLSRPPKGYSADNPAIEYLKLKSFVVTQNLADSALSPKTLTNTLRSFVETVKPLVDFLNQAVVV